MRRTEAVLLLALSSVSFAETLWRDATVVNISTANDWCRHCPDWNQTSYSFKLDDGAVYIAQSHKRLDITVNDHTKLRFEKDGHVGDHVHMLDDAGKEQTLRVAEKMAADKRPD